MLFLILLGIILLFINRTVGVLYISGMLIALTFALIAKEEKNKRG